MPILTGFRVQFLRLHIKFMLCKQNLFYYNKFCGDLRGFCKDFKIILVFSKNNPYNLR